MTKEVELEGGQLFLASVERSEEFLHLKADKNNEASVLKQILLFSV